MCCSLAHGRGITSTALLRVLDDCASIFTFASLLMYYHTIDTEMDALLQNLKELLACIEQQIGTIKQSYITTILQ